MYSEEKEVLKDQLNKATSELQNQYQTELEDLKAGINEKENEITDLKSQLKQIKSTSDKLHAQKNELSHKNADYSKEMNELKKRNDELLEAYKKVDKECNAKEEKYKSQQLELSKKLQYAAHKLKTSDERTRKHLNSLQGIRNFYKWPNTSKFSICFYNKKINSILFGLLK